MVLRSIEGRSTMTQQEVYSARQAARFLNTTERTVRRWIDTGKLAGTRADDGQPFQITREAIERKLGRPLIELDAQTAQTTPTETIAERLIADGLAEPIPTVRRGELVNRDSWVERAVRAETRLATLAELLDVDAGISTIRQLVAAWTVNS